MNTAPKHTQYEDMMDSYTIYSCLEIISGESSKLVKIAFLEEFLEDEDFAKVCRYAYDPLKTFGVLKPVPFAVAGPQENFNETTWSLLDRLASRELTGNAAKEEIYEQAFRLNEESLQLLNRILKKDLRAGFSVTSLNKAHSGFIKSPPYMRCSTMKQVPLKRLNWKDGVYAQRKADGMFVNIDVGFNFKYTIITRHGQSFPEGFGNLEKMLYGGYAFHGEAMVVHQESGEIMSRKQGNGKLNSVLKGGSLPEGWDVNFLLWDMITLDAKKLRISHVPYAIRFEGLREMCRNLGPKVNTVESPELFTIEDAEWYFEKILKEGGEGVILKDKAALWKHGTSQMQVKMKAEKECELLVVGFNEGKGKYEGMCGSVDCMSSDGGIRVNVPGFTDKQRKEIWEEKQEWLDTVLTVRFNEVIDSQSHGGAQSLYLPRFVERRFDKHESDTTEYILGL